jgi:hypothetical protein
MEKRKPEPTATEPAAGPREPRRFVYRAVEPETAETHPGRRRTDTPRAFQGVAGELSPRVELLKMRVYLKLN